MIREYLTQRGYTPPDAGWYAKIQSYLDWYRNEVPEFHNYTVFNGASRVGKKRFRLGMAKTVCEDHADLLLNEKTVIAADGFDALPGILERNHFSARANQLIEIAFALGTGAFVEYKGADGLPNIDFIRADQIFPLSWDNGTVTECAFASRKSRAGKSVYYVQLHRLEHGRYVLENVYLDESGKRISPPDGIADTVQTGSTVPLFQLITPNIVNNAALDCPMGISVYGNAITQLQAVDLVYDSYVNDFVVGRARLIVPQSLAQIQMQEDGTMRPIFDPSDTLFYVYAQSDDGSQGLKDFVMNLRSDAHETALQRQLDLLSKKCGLGSGRYRFESGAVKTATEVISDKSDLYQVRQKNELPIRAALCSMVRALSFLSGNSADIGVSVSFDDSIINDAQAIVDRNVLLVNSGLRPRADAIMEIEQCDRAEAERRIREIDHAAAVGGQSIDRMIAG